MTKTLTPNYGILNSPPYVAGAHTIDGVDKAIVLSANENPLGCSPMVKDAVANTVFNRYPQGGSDDVCDALGALHNLPSSNIVCGAGSDEILHLLIYAYAGKGDEVLYPEYGFLIYPIATLTAGATPKTAPEKQYTVCVDSLLNCITDKTKIICVANPGNPTGTMLVKSEIERLVKNTPPHILLILDGAYAEYVQEDTYTAGAEFVKDHANVVMTRTFSKAYGLAGIRLGWAYASDAVVDVLNRVRCPFNVSSTAQNAGLTGIKDQDFIAKSIASNAYWKNVLVSACVAQGMSVPPSHTNFILVKFSSEQNANDAYITLQKHGVLARLVKAYGLPDCIRITIGTEAENKHVLNAITDMKA